MSAIWALLVSGGLYAADFTVDTAHSTLEFSVQSKLFDVRGTFAEWEGAASLPDDAAGDLSKLTGSIAINVASVDTHVRKRDEHLRSADFFDVAAHPRATFTVGAVAMSGQTANVSGKLAMRGISHELTIPLEVRHQDADRLRLVGELVVKRQAFGIDFDSSVNPIADDVRITVDLNLMRDGAPPMPELLAPVGG